MTIAAETIEAMEEHLGQMVRMQREKVFALARRRVPNLTADDALNPHDFPELAADANFNFEDGILSGFIQAQISLRAAFFRPAREGS